jgi:uncharacterized protein with gpF-like domain
MQAAADLVKEKGPEFAKEQIETVLLDDDLAIVIRRIYANVGIKTGKRVLREIKQSAVETKVGDSVDERWTRQILEFFKLYLLTKAVMPITQETRRRIIEIIDKGISEGWSVDKMAFELETDSFTLVRARLITRTEILKAQFYGEKLGESESEWETVSQWIAAKDHRTRHSHRNIDGEVVKSGNKFAVDRYRGKVKVGTDMMEGPGDPNASAENVIQCRCTRAVTAARDEHGRLIKKVGGKRNIFTFT